MERVIGRHTGSEKGPLLICIGGIHGNELAGVRALELLLKMIEVEPITNPNFSFKGRLLGLRGNVEAQSKGLRFLDKDLNRLWIPEIVDRVCDTPCDKLKGEERELKELWTLIQNEIEEYQPERVLLLDIHTTSAFGGIFTLPAISKNSHEIALELHAPVIMGMLEGIRGTTLHYFTTENMGVHTDAVCFEAGQHHETLSVNRAIAAVINCMRTIGIVESEHVENQHDRIIQDFSRDLPMVSELVYCHRIDPSDGFNMRPGYGNFQEVQGGETIALDRNGSIRSPSDGLILMPLYQKQGEEGFFIIREIEEMP
jgi:succinylglutamate desuccinylase